MKLSRNQLLAIKGLSLSNVVNDMNDSQIDEYCKALQAFTENFPIQESKLKGYFNSKDYDAFSEVHSNIIDMLDGIYATNLAQSGLRMTSELNNQKYNIVEAHLTYLLAEISELSIEIQMAWQKGELGKDAEKTVPSIKFADANVDDNAQKTILAVDDVSLTLNALKLALNDTKYKLIGVKSGAEALRFIRNNRPDLFILDIEMPIMNGYQLAEYIKSSGQTAPIIFLTGNAKQEYVLKAIALGAVDFIVKPINNDNVLEKIKKFIG